MLATPRTVSQGRLCGPNALGGGGGGNWGPNGGETLAKVTNVFRVRLFASAWPVETRPDHLVPGDPARCPPSSLDAGIAESAADRCPALRAPGLLGASNRCACVSQAMLQEQGPVRPGGWSMWAYHGAANRCSSFSPVEEPASLGCAAGRDEAQAHGCSLAHIEAWPRS